MPEKHNVALALSLLTLAAFLAVGFASPKEAFAVDYIVSDETSCLALPGGSPEWIDATSTCQIDGDLEITFDSMLIVNSGTTLEVTSGGTFNYDTTRSYNTILNMGTIINSGTIDIDALNDVPFANSSMLQPQKEGA